MMKNPILEELHAVREKLLAEAGGTLDGLVDAVQANERESKQPRYTGSKNGDGKAVTNGCPSDATVDSHTS